MLYRLTTFVGLLLWSFAAGAVEPISDLNLQPLSGATDSFTTTPPAGFGAPFDNPAQTWTVAANGSDLEITSVDVPTGPLGADENFEFVRLADELRLRRIDNATVTGVRGLVFRRGAANTRTFTIPCESTPLEDMDTILLGRAINFGTDNLFDNTSENRNNIERADFIYKSGLTVPAGAVADVGFVVLERSGNDDIRRQRRSKTTANPTASANDTVSFTVTSKISRRTSQSWTHRLRTRSARTSRM